MRIIRPVLPLILLAFVLTACSGSASLAPVGEAALDNAEKPAVAAPAPGGGPVIDGQAIGTRDDAKIIRTGTMDLEVRDVPSAVRAARDAIVGLGGYVGASNTSNQGDRPTAEITYRIPADRWEAALDTLRSLNGLTTKVVTESTAAVEVTAQVVDLEARIRNLQASEVALLGIAAKATKITDVLEVQTRLTEVRGQIEQLTAQLKELSDRAGFATLAVRYNVPLVAVEVAARSWEPRTAIDEAAATMLAILQNLVTAGIWFAIVWLPILIVVGVLAVIGVRIGRRIGFRAHEPSTTWQTPTAPPSAPPASEG